MIGYWLIPAEPQKSQLAAIVGELARKYDAPLFEPHVTLYSSDDDETLATALTTQLAVRSRPIELRITGIEHSEKFTKTLFVQFEQNDDAQQLSDLLREGSTTRHDYKLNPHLSLLYAKISEQEKAAEARRIQVPFTTTRCDALAAVLFPTLIESRADVEAWRIVAKAKLGR